MSYQFDSTVRSLGTFRTDFPVEVVKNEPMFFNADREFAYRNGGPVTRAFLDSLPDGWDDLVLDSRVHMLMPGWCPAIPGYHHDDVPRKETDGQPDYDSPAYHSEHICGLVGAEICPTVFAVGKCELPAVPAGQVVYKVWHDHTERLIREGVLRTQEVSSGVLYWFDWQSLHTATFARQNGWRWFCRVSRQTDRLQTRTNEIRRQVQVYLPDPTMGW